MTSTSETSFSNGVTTRVQKIIAQALELEPAEVRLSASLFDELGAESLDLLDIVFSLEKEFRLRLPRRDLLQRASEVFGKDALIQDGVLTAFGVDLVRRSMPEADLEKGTAQLHPVDVQRMITPQTFVRIVDRLLQARQELPQDCPSCQSQLQPSRSAPEMCCSECGKTVALPSGDEVLLQDMIETARNLVPTGHFSPGQTEKEAGG